MELVNFASHSCRILIGQLKQKLSKSCQKDVTKLSQSNQRLCLVATRIAVKGQSQEIYKRIFTYYFWEGSLTEWLGR